MGCIFCEIVKGSKKGFILYQDESTMALLDVCPSVEGHAMVIPKKHLVTILDLSQNELGEVFATVKKVVKALQTTYATDKFTIGINHGERFGVPHLHIHIIPRFEGDGGGIIQTIVKKEVKEDLETIKNNIKKNFVS